MTLPLDATAADKAHLELYVRANLLIVIGAACGLVVIDLVVLRSGWILVDTAVVLGVVAAMLVAQHLLAAGRTLAALYTIAFANWTASVVTTAITPFVLPIITMVVLLPVVLMVPHAARSTLLRMISASVFVALVATVFAELHLVDLEDRAPWWLLRVILYVAVPAVVGLLGISAWQNHVGLAAQTHELRSSRARVVEAADQERRRIEQDLHDGTQQRLVSIAVQLGLVRRIAGRDPTRADAMLHEVIAELDDAMGELRQLAHGVYPPLLNQRGLAEALDAAVARSTLPVRLRCRSVGRYEPRVETAVYFCCLEALQNAAKHADAREVVVRVDGRDGLLVEITDDGCGFDPAATSGGQGFTNMSDRVGAVGGRVQVRSTPAHGTSVQIRVDTVAIHGAPGADGTSGLRLPAR